MKETEIRQPRDILQDAVVIEEMVQEMKVRFSETPEGIELQRQFDEHLIDEGAFKQKFSTLFGRFLETQSQ